MSDLSIQGGRFEPPIPQDAFLGFGPMDAQLGTQGVSQAARPVGLDDALAPKAPSFEAQVFDVVDDVVDFSESSMRSIRQGWERTLFDLPNMPPGQKAMVIETLMKQSDIIRNLGFAGTLSDALVVLTSDNPSKEVVETVASNMAGAWAGAELAAAGFAVGGPPGAAIGFVVGSTVGSNAAEYAVGEAYDFVTEDIPWESIGNGIEGGFDAVVDYGSEVADEAYDLVGAGVDYVSDLF